MSCKPKLLRYRKFTGIPPKSTNNLYTRGDTGMWHKTYSYRLFRKAMTILLKKDGFLPSSEEEWKGHGLYIEAGIIKEFDLDNTLKGIIDALQETYEFNDNLINGIIAKKKPVGTFPLSKSEWSTQYILIGFIEYDNDDCNIFDASDFTNAESTEITTPTKIREVLFRSVTEDWTNVKNSRADKKAVYPLQLYPDVEKVAGLLDVTPEKLIKQMKEFGAEYKIEEHICKTMGEDGIDTTKIRRELKNKIKKDEFEKLLGNLRTRQ